MHGPATAVVVEQRRDVGPGLLGEGATGAEKRLVNARRGAAVAELPDASDSLSSAPPHMRWPRVASRCMPTAATSATSGAARADRKASSAARIGSWRSASSNARIDGYRVRRIGLETTQQQLAQKRRRIRLLGGLAHAAGDHRLEEHGE